MKKVLSFVAVLAMTAFVASCGDDSAQQKADSTRIADSVHNVWVADSTAKAAAEKATADSLAKVAADARIADSLRQDSIAKAGKPGAKPKTLEQKVKEEAKKATSGRG